MHALRILCIRELTFAQVLDPAFFFSGQQTTQHDNQLLAGSLIGFLICIFGQEKLRHFARQLARDNAQSCVKMVFGLSPADLWMHWREHLQSLIPQLQPGLNKMIAHERARAAYQAGRFDECLSHLAPLLQSSPAPLEVLFNAARAHQALARHDKAVDLLSRLVEAPPQAPFIERNAWRDEAYLTLGMSYDALGQRDLAIEAYQAAWDCAEPQKATWLRRLANKYRRYPYPEEKMYQ